MEQTQISHYKPHIRQSKLFVLQVFIFLSIYTFYLFYLKLLC